MVEIDQTMLWRGSHSSASHNNVHVQHEKESTFAWYHFVSAVPRQSDPPNGQRRNSTGNNRAANQLLPHSVAGNRQMPPGGTLLIVSEPYSLHFFKLAWYPLWNAVHIHLLCKSGNAFQLVVHGKEWAFLPVLSKSPPSFYTLKLTRSNTWQYRCRCGTW